ncbi:hypothetical protein M0M57_15020 [Flavobacterium azooxidireducens]|uniref:Uncharacterized protein n=1 Tax=Flavobacterium azooxidireducens TaxID=1871076 RepID=A0ABY4KDM7_9FLAO|nr:hypothetical protein [Flavobacterium azooxidireducens]UPQ78918.1 hypothetical protein M0M57_15020 [Flavobacterium azooxidireducens]
MYRIKPHEYFSNIFGFLRNENDNGLNLKNLFYYIFAILVIVIIGQIVVANSNPFKLENNKNKKFIKDEIKTQLITDTFNLPIKQTYFNSNFVIKLKNNSTYRINLENNTNIDKIALNVLIEKKANDKKFIIINNNSRYQFEIEELNNCSDRKFVLFASLFFSIIAIPF